MCCPRNPCSIRRLGMIVAFFLVGEDGNNAVVAASMLGLVSENIPKKTLNLLIVMY